MKNHFFLLIPTILVTGCLATKAVKNKTVVQAIGLQYEVIHDPLFFKILRELEAENGIDWKEGSLQYVKQNISSYENNMAWLLEMYTTRGGYALDSVRLWRKLNPMSPTTAATYTCRNRTKLNRWKLKRDKYSILNTLIHERVHSFCLTHPDSQTRPDNMCDASYISGDLAEAIILFRSGIVSRKMNKPICPTLMGKINEYGLIEITE